MLDKLFQTRELNHTIIRLYRRQKRFHQHDEDMPSWHSLFLQRAGIARAIRKDILKGQYRPYPTKNSLIHQKNKTRLMFKYHPIDQVIQSTLSTLLQPLMKPFVAQQLYNFKGRSIYTVHNDFRDYLTQHTHQQRCNLYVLKYDISAYYDCISTHADSILWQNIQQLLSQLQVSKQDQHQLISLFKNYLRPDVVDSQGQPCYSLIHGVPTGAALSTIAAILYLQEADFSLSQQPNLFYARYGDDILLSHPDPDTLLKADESLNAILKRLKLRRNPEKDGYFYFTRSGSPSPDPRFQPSQRIEHLGFSINGKGLISLKKEGKNDFLKDIRRRIRSINQTYQNMPIDEKGPLITDSLNQVLNLKVFKSPDKITQLLNTCNDRGELKDIDYHIALSIACILTGRHGPKAFQIIPYKKIRDQWGLLSLLNQRNQRK